jgi:hypothetical protein
MLPTAQAVGVSVLRRGYRHASPKALPKPFYVLCRVVVSMQARSTRRAGMPADGQAFGDHDAAATTGLRGIGGIDGDDPATGACCLVRQDDEERAPSHVTDGLRQMVILHHVGGL